MTQAVVDGADAVTVPAAVPAGLRSPWAMVAVALSAGQAAMALSWIGGMYRYVRSADVFQSDFTAFYTAARMTLHGQAHSLYDLASQQRTQEAVRGVRLQPSTLLAYVNPPFATLPLTPLGWLPYRAAFLLWFGLQLLVLALTVRAVLSTVATGWSRAERVLLVGAIVTCVATLTSLSLGSLAILALLAATRLTAAVRTGRTRHAGWWLLLLAVKPQLAILCVVGLVGLRCWTILRDAALAGAVAAVASTVVFGTGVWTAWLRLLQRFGSAEGLYGVDAHYMWNLRGAIARSGLADRATADLLATSALMISALIVLVIAVRAGRGGSLERTDRTMGIAATIALTVLTATHCNRQDTTLLLLAAALAYGHLRSRPGGRLFGCVILASWLLAWAVGNQYDGPSLHPVTVLAVGLVLVAGVQARASGRRSEIVHQTRPCAARP